MQSLHGVSTIGTVIPLPIETAPWAMEILNLKIFKQ